MDYEGESEEDQNVPQERSRFSLPVPSTHTSGVVHPRRTGRTWTWLLRELAVT